MQGQLQEVVAEQQSEEIEHPMTRDEILSTVLGERSGYVRGKGYGKKPPKKSNTQHANIESSVSSAMEIVHQEMQAEMDRKLQEEREQMAAELKRNMELELQRKLAEEREHANAEVQRKLAEEREHANAEVQRKLAEEREHANAEVGKRIHLEVDKRMHEQFASFMIRMQQQSKAILIYEDPKEIVIPPSEDEVRILIRPILHLEPFIDDFNSSKYK